MSARVPPRWRRRPPPAPINTTTEDTLRRLATTQAAAGESLDSVHLLVREVIGDDQPDVLNHALRIAGTTWADAVATRLNRLECSDPLTGLSTIDHLLAYVAAQPATDGSPTSLTAVVLDLTTRRLGDPETVDSPLSDSLRLAVVDEELEKVGDLAARRARVGRRRLVFLAADGAATPHVLAGLSVRLTQVLRRSSDGTNIAISTQDLDPDPHLAGQMLRSIVR